MEPITLTPAQFKVLSRFACTLAPLRNTLSSARQEGADMDFGEAHKDFGITQLEWNQLLILIEAQWSRS